jgi:outer membrane receptor for ferrienterochelin and colicins
MSLPKNTPYRLTVVAAAMAAVMSAHAQQAEPAAAAPQAAPKPARPAEDKMQKVEVRGSVESYDPRRDDTASKIVVNHEEIVKYGDTNVVDVLKRLPGITVSGASGRGGGEIRMRGLGAGYTQILLNGERAPAGFSLDSLSPDVIERIEVLRAASAEFSTQSIAGTINIILKKAIKKAQRELKLGVGGGHGFLNPNANLQLSDKAGNMSYSLSGNAFYQKFNRESPTVEEGFDPAGRRNMLRNSASNDRGQFSAINIAPRLNWTLENGDTITSQSFVNVNRFSITSRTDTITPIGTAPQYSTSESLTSNQNEFFRTDLNWVHKLASGSKLDVKIGGVLGGLGNEQRRFGYNQAGALILDSSVHSKGTDRGLTSTGKFSTPMFEGHALSVGWDGGISTRADARVQKEVPLPGAFPVNSDENFDARVNRLAVYAQDEWNVTPRWSVYLGTRWEGIRTNTSGNTFSAAESTSSVWSPLFQTLYKLPGTKADQVRFAVTRTYKAPNTQNLIPRRFASINNSSTDPDFQGNPNLKPELALGIDASYEHYWGEGALLSASASMRRIDDFTRQGVFFQNGRWVQLPVNDGQANTRGIELEAKFPLKSLVAAAPAIDLRASISRNWSSVDAVPGPDNRLNEQTPFSATLGMDYKAGALTTGGSFAFKNGGPVRISVQQTSYQSVRRDLELYGLWKFDPRNQLRVAVSNILGQDFIAEKTYADASGTVHRTSIFPGTVVLRATMEMKF